MYRYPVAALDRAALIRTLLTILGLFCLLVLVAVIRQLAPPITVLAVPLLIAPALAYASSPLSYRLDERMLRIERRALWPVNVPLSQVTAYGPLYRTALQGAIRLYGTGGFFGWSGRYQAKMIGKCSMHATNLDRLIMIQRRHRRPLLISPDDPEAFLRGLRAQYETIVIPAQAAPR